MKRILFIMLAGILLGLFIYQMNKVSLTPMEGLTVDGKNVESGVMGSPETTFEPLDLSFLDNLLVHPAVAATTNPVLSRISPRSLGNPEAPVRMYLFSSLTCPHCSSVHTDVLKDIEEKYIKTGKVFMTYIDFPSDKRSLAGSMLARCIPEENYFSFLELLFKNQRQWAFTADAEDIITTYASLQGLSKGDVRACLADQALKNGIISTRDMYMKKYDITVTPTIVFEKGKEIKIVKASNAGKINAALKQLAD